MSEYAFVIPLHFLGSPTIVQKVTCSFSSKIERKVVVVLTVLDLDDAYN